MRRFNGRNHKEGGCCGGHKNKHNEHKGDNGSEMKVHKGGCCGGQKQEQKEHKSGCCGNH